MGVRVRKCVAVLVGVAVSLLGSIGCSTFNRIMHYPKPPQVYGGIRTIRETYEEFFEVQVAPTDPEAIKQSTLLVLWTPHGISFGLLFIADMTATVVADTLLLPFTVPAELLQKKESDVPVNAPSPELKTTAP